MLKCGNQNAKTEVLEITRKAICRYQVDKYHTDFFVSFFPHNHTPSGNKMVTGVQVITASQAQSICRWQAISSCP